MIEKNICSLLFEHLMNNKKIKINGVGLSVQNSNELTVFLEDQTDINKIPLKFKGYEVNVKITGKFRALKSKEE